MVLLKQVLYCLFRKFSNCGSLPVPVIFFLLFAVLELFQLCWSPKLVLHRNNQPTPLAVEIPTVIVRGSAQSPAPAAG